MKRLQIVLATKNTGKLREIREILGDIPIEFLTLQSFPDAPDVEEDGHSYRENALKKATAIFNHTSMLTMAEDSGLEVEAIGNAPGIYSARFSGKDATSKKNIERLLSMMKDIPAERRTARFVCVLALVGMGIEQFFEGEVKGTIALHEMGESGFGYDPVFIPDGYENSFAELGKEVKNRISHRTAALRRFKEFMDNYQQR